MCNITITITIISNMCNITIITINNMSTWVEHHGLGSPSMVVHVV